MQDEKDRLGEKLHEVRKAREDQWARQQDEALFEKIRAKMAQSRQAGAPLKCPQCGKALVARVRDGCAMMACPDEQGAWLDSATLQTILKAPK